MGLITMDAQKNNISAEIKKFMQEIIFVAVVALAPMISLAQGIDSTKAKPTMWAPYNSASVLANRAYDVAMRPPEIGLFGIIQDNKLTTGMIANINTEIGDSSSLGGMGAVKTGICISASRTTVQGSAAIDAAAVFASAGITTGAGLVQVGAKIPYSGKDGNLKAGAASVGAAILNPRVRASADVIPTNQKQPAIAVFAGDVLLDGGIAVSGTAMAQDGKTPKQGIGIEKKFANGWQVFGSMHPERAFFGGKANPNLGVRWTNKNSTFNVNVQPQAKSVKIGVGLRY